MIRFHLSLRTAIAALSAALCTQIAFAVPSISLDFEQVPQSLVRSQWKAVQQVQGVSGLAFRSDGFSTWVEAPAKLDGKQYLGAALWVALESYPSDREGPVSQATPSSFLNSASKNAGFDLFVDTYGRWGLTVATTKGQLKLTAPDLFPLYKWTRVGFAVNPRTRAVTLLRDGRVITTAILRSEQWVPAAAPLIMAKSWRDVQMLNFRVNALNGAFDNLVVTQDERDMPLLFRDGITAPASVNESLAVPASRFAHDHLRPKFHAMPPANWTNEPHGLVLAGGRYHMFYQRTPNGPFKTQMTWGHMSSEDLVNWTHHRDALRPSLQSASEGFDMKGIWSGDVITEGGKAFAYYTSVNHGRSFNPGISVAISSDPLLENWDKGGPIIDTAHVKDFRDPYLWKEGDTWHMIIGAAYEGFGGLDYYSCNNKTGRSCWKRHPRFSSIPYVQLDTVDSVIWEMPVFEEVGDRRVLVVNPIGGKVTKYGDPTTRGVYWLGKWNGDQFVPDAAEPKNLDVIPGHLSPTVVRQPNGTLVGIGIVDERRSSQAQEDAGWAHTFSLPREWFLSANGRSLGQRPLATLSKLRKESATVIGAPGLVRGNRFLGDVGHQAEFKLKFSPGTQAPYGVDIAKSPDGSQYTRVTYDPATREVLVDRTRSTTSPEEEGPRILRGKVDVDAFGEPLDWHVFVDGSVVDVFLGNGAAFSFRTYPTRRDATRIELFAQSGAQVEAATLWGLSPSKFDYDLN